MNDFGRTLQGEEEKSPADAVVDEITAAGGEAVADHGDVADWDDSLRLVQTAVERFGQLDILVNNAGFLRDRMLFNMSEEDFDARRPRAPQGPLLHVAPRGRRTGVTGRRPPTRPCTGAS